MSYTSVFSFGFAAEGIWEQDTLISNPSAFFGECRFALKSAGFAVNIAVR
jgi:hypothetical protein